MKARATTPRKRHEADQSAPSAGPGRASPASWLEVWRERCRSRSDHVALVFLPDGETEAERLTYAELDDRARRVAAVLHSRGFAGQPVLLALPSGVDFVAALLGCLHAGAIAVPAYAPLHDLHTERLSLMARDCEARAVLHLANGSSRAAALSSQVAGSRPGCAVLDLAEVLATQPAAWQPAEPHADTLAFLQYTSGSTGQPRGVMVTHGNLLAYFEQLRSLWGNDENDVCVSWLPLFHDMGIGSLLYLFHLGGSHVMLPPMAFLQKPLRWLQALTRYGGTICAAPDFAFGLCASAADEAPPAPLDLSRWRIACNAAEPVRADTLQRFADRFAAHGFRRDAFSPSYGLAEAVLSVTVTAPLAPAATRKVSATALLAGKAVAADEGESSRTLVSCGRPHARTTVAIVEPASCEVCADGRVGEIWIAGPSVTAGYWRQPEATEATFGARTLGGEGPFLRTGDLGVLIDGELYVTGRIKDLIVIRGANHHPQDIEHTVAQASPALEPGRGAAFPVEHEGQERLVVVQELHRRSLRDLKGEETAAVVRQAVIDAHGIDPLAIVLVKPGVVPLTSSGKIQRQACRAAYLEGDRFEPLHAWRESTVVASLSASQPAASVASYDSVSSWIRAAIARRKGLKPDAVSFDQPFASFGLDSLEIVSLSGELSAWLDRELSPTLVYDHPTIRRYAEAVAGCAAPQPAHAQLGATAPAAGGGVAVVGMACRFPGADTPDAYWRLLETGTDAITEVPAERWAVDEYYSAEWPRAGKMNTRWGGFLRDVDRFDAAFFNISPLEAAGMDPQQRLLLELTWHALEDAGIPASALAGGNAGVFIGANGLDYRQLQLRAGVGIDPYAGLGSGLAISANRISYFLDLHGPSWTVDSACSSSLVALHQARCSLLAGECDLAIVGGVSLVLDPEGTVLSSQSNLLSPEGRCKTFDAGADGYVRSEGCGVVVLKREADALRDGDRLHAVVAGSAVNQDGRSNGLTAPNGLAQQSVIRQALASAGIEPAQVGCIEAQGTGTALGDPIEMGALEAVYGAPSDAVPTLWVGSVKTNIGHLEPASGIAALIKVVLMLRQRRIAPHLHLRELNPLIRLDSSRLAIPGALQDWPAPEGGVRLAGVSAFGLGGANAHVIVREAPTVEPVVNTDAAPLLTLSAKSETALARLAADCADALEQSDAVVLAAVCSTSNLRRTHHAHRLALPVASLAQATQSLRRFAQGGPVDEIVSGFAGRAPEGQLAFVFAGLASIHPGAGQVLHGDHAGFRDTFDRCDAAFLALTGESLRGALQGDAAALARRGQPALFALQCALAAVWRSCGLEPQAVIGHGAGALAAACTAGVFSLEDGMRLAVHLGRLADAALRAGALYALHGSESIVAALLAAFEAETPKDGRIVERNSALDAVVFGESAALRQWLAPWLSRDVVLTRLPVRGAIDASQVAAGAVAFARETDGIAFSAPAIPLVSSASGRIAGTEVTTAQHWLDALAKCVEFSLGMQALAAAGCGAFIEIGGHPVVSAAGRRAAPDALWLHSLDRDANDGRSLARNLARWHVAGGTVDWQRRARDAAGAGFRPCAPVALPPYPFQRERHWFKARAASRTAAWGREAVHPLLGRRIELARAAGQWYFENVLDEDEPAFLQQHHIFGLPVLPGASLAEWMLAAAEAVQPHAGWTISDLAVDEAVIVGGVLRTQTLVAAVDGGFEVQAMSRDGDAPNAPWRTHVSATVQPIEGLEPRPAPVTSGALIHWTPHPIDGYHDQLARAGLEYGPLFRGLKQVWQHGEEALARIECAPFDAASSYRLNPLVLDACYHVVGTFAEAEAMQQVLLPVAFRRLAVVGALPAQLWCHVRWHGRVGHDRCEADLTLLDDAWQEIARVDGLQFADVSSEPAYATLYAACGVAPAEDAQAVELARFLRSSVGAMPIAEAKVQLLDYLLRRVAGVMALDAARQAELRPTFARVRINELGIDSLMAVRLRNHVLSELGVDIPVQMFVGGSEAIEIVDQLYRDSVLNQIAAQDAADAPCGEDTEEFVL